MAPPSVPALPAVFPLIRVSPASATVFEAPANPLAFDVDDSCEAASIDRHAGSTSDWNAQVIRNSEFAVSQSNRSSLQSTAEHNQIVVERTSRSVSKAALVLAAVIASRRLNRPFEVPFRSLALSVNESTTNTVSNCRDSSSSAGASEDFPRRDARRPRRLSGVRPAADRVGTIGSSRTSTSEQPFARKIIGLKQDAASHCETRLRIGHDKVTVEASSARRRRCRQQELRTGD